MSERDRPDRMDRCSRNERLYAFLRNMGLWVEPVFFSGQDGGLDYLKVAVAQPRERVSTEMGVSGEAIRPIDS